MHLNFSRSVEPATAGGIGHTRHLLAQVKDNRRLCYHQEQLWPENLRIWGLGQKVAIALRADPAIFLRAREKFLILGSFAFFPNQGNRDLPKVLFQFKP